MCLLTLYYCYIEDMNRNQIQRVDSIIKSHGAIIDESSSLSSKVIYSISCLQSAIQFQNPNRNANINYLQSIIGKLISIGQKSKEIAEDHMRSLLGLLNNLLTEGNNLSIQSEASLIQIVLKVDIVNGGIMGEDIFNEIVSLCSKIKNQGQTSQLLLRLMAQKMSPEQALRLIDSFRKNELYVTEIYQLIKLGNHYKNNIQLLCRMLEALHWQIRNILNQKSNLANQGQQIIDFISGIVQSNKNQVKIVSLCALIYRQVVDVYKYSVKGHANKELDTFLRENSIKASFRPYLLIKDKLISNFSSSLSVLESEIDVQQNKHLHQLLNFYSTHEFQWRQDLLSSVSNGKGMIAKQLLLRATEDFTGFCRVSKGINEKDETVYSNFLPIQCLRSQSSILMKLKKDPSPHNALRIIRLYHLLQKNHPLFNEILLQLLQIYLKNREFSSLKQVQRIIKQEIKGDFVISKLSEKGSIKNKDSNRQSKRYFICLPLVCSRSDTQSVSDVLSQIFIHQTVDIAFKFYVADFTISKMILNPSKAFFVFFTRFINSNYNSQIGKIVLLYLTPHSLNDNPAVSQWFLKNFGEITEKLTQFLFSKLVIPQIKQTSKILFLLEKFNIYGQAWINSYGWILNSLEDANQIYQDHTTDCFEILQMVLQKITVGNVPEAHARAFEKIILKNWGKYNQEHLFAIERIMQILNQHSCISFKQKSFPSLEAIINELNKDQKSKKNNDILVKYINDLTFNLLFSHIDSHTAFQTLIKFMDQMKGEKQKMINQKPMLAIMNLLLYLFQGSQEVVDEKADIIVVTFLEKHWQNTLKVRGKCLEYLSRVPHNINILKISLFGLTRQCIYNPVWMGDIAELINIVSQSKPKAIGTFKLQQNLKSMMIYLIGLQKSELSNILLDYIQATCFIEGDYQVLLDQSLQVMQNWLIAQRCGIGYRKQIVQFALGTLLDYQYALNQDLLWFLMSKYASEPLVIRIILEYFEKFPITTSVIPQKLLMRVVLLHPQDEKIQQKCKTMFKMHAPKSSAQQQLLQCFANSNFDKCQELIGQVSNPYALTFSLPDIKSLLQWKNTFSNCKKLLSFLHNHPQHQNKLYQCQAFILNSSYVSYLAEIIDKIDAEPVLQKFQNQKKVCLILKRHQGLDILQKTLINILKNKASALKLKNLFLQTFKSREDEFSILLKLIVLIFSRQKKENRSNEQLKNYATFWGQLSGELQLKNRQKASKFITKNLIYIFPFFLSNAQIVSQYTSLSSLLRHYRSVLTSYSSIQKQICSNRYFNLLLNSLLQQSRNTQNKGSFVEEYLRTYLYLEGYQELNLKADDKAKYIESLTELNDFVNGYTQSKTRQSSNKLEVNFIIGFIAHSLFLINQGINLDIATFQIIKNINANIDSLTCAQNQKEITKQALQWLMKIIEKNLPLKAVEQKSSTKVEKHMPQQSSYISKKLYESKKNQEELYKTKRQSFSPTTQKQGLKKQEIQVQFAQYTSKRREQQPNSSEKRQQQPYIKYKQTQENITIKQTITTNKTTIVVLNAPATSSQEIFNEQVQKPKEEAFNQDKFYKPQANSEQLSGIPEAERKNILLKAQNIAAGAISINSLKEHCKYIQSLTLFPKINASQFAQLRTSIASIDQTVSSHSFYVRKVCEYELTLKLVRIYKTMWRAGEKKNCESLVLDILQLYLSMSKMKQRKLVLLSEEEVIQFFKMVVKRSLNSQGQDKEIQFLLEIIYNCRNNTEIYFTLGLLSMLIEMVNRDKDPSVVFILEYFIKIQLTPHIINQIYQRGLFNKLVQCFNAPLPTLTSKKILCLWIRLAGKVCINQSIQQKFRSKQLHTLLWEKLPQLTKPSQRKDITYFLAYLCLKNEAITQWMIQAKVPQELLNTLGELTDNEQLYLLFYHFCFGSTINRDYCIRIKYHMYLMGRLTQRWHQTQQNTQQLQLSKYFYKSLGQMMTSRQHSSVFFKEQCVKKMIQIFDNKCEPSIFECLLDFISVIETDAEFDELKKQKFWQSLKIFQYKISSQATYSYLLQIFLIMIKKGRTQQFKQAELRNKVCLKAQFSINMQGKQLALRFILALSIKDKQNYFNQRGINLLASVLGFKVSKNQLQLTSDMLKVQGASKNQQYLRYFINANIHGLISENLQKLTQEQLKIAYNILLSFSQQSQFLKLAAQMFLPFANKQLEKQSVDNLSILLQLLNCFSGNQSNRDLFMFLQIEKNINNQMISAKAKQKNCQKQHQQLIKNIQKLKGMTAVQNNNQQQLKKAVTTLRQGKKVKMYKVDGSVSELFIYISSDCLELNCGVTLSEVVKQKWRLPLNEITKTIEYSSQISPQFTNSYFEKNSGFFSKAPPAETCLSLIGKNNQFHICFPPGEKQTWKANLQLARQYAKNLLSNLGKK